MATRVNALGLMSGTSLDGIDVAMIESDGEDQVVRGPSATFPYNADMRRKLRQALADARHLRARHERPGCLATVEAELTELHAAAVAAFLRSHGLKREAIGVVGFHGQTVLHRAASSRIETTATGVPFDVIERGMTVQLGLGGKLADLTRLPVVYDLRAADVAAGGQGAPLVPVYHRALAAGLPQRPLAILNIGGVANVTFIDADGTLIAFDTGPGNALLDDWMLRHAKLPFDADGAVAARGRADEERVRFYLGHSYFGLPPPKSLDRDAFALELVDGLSLEDGAATLTRFTVESIARAREVMPAEPALWVVCGGGRKNRTLMSGLAGRVENAVVPAEAVGFDGDAMEAEAWAYLAVRSMRGLPLTFPGTTGAPVPMSGGRLVEPSGAGQ